MRYGKRLRLRGARARWLPCSLLLGACLHAGVTLAGDAPITLWPEGAPGSEGWTQVETETHDFLPHRVIRNVVEPTLTPYLAVPAVNTGVAVVIAPGGGFKFLSIDPEGTQVAEWLRERGINAFVLKYRLDETAANDTLFKLQVGWLFLLAAINSREDFPVEPMSPVSLLAIDDALAALAYVRRNAEEWQLDTGSIGIMGFSAGGTVATGAAMRGRDSSRPDFIGSIYGVPDVAGVPPDAPPLYAMTAMDDPIVPAHWTETLHQRWQDAGFRSTLVQYPDGGHGFGMQEKGTTSDGWIEAFYQWLVATTGTSTPLHSARTEATPGDA